MKDNEREIIQKAQEGDREAFGALYDHYLPNIYRFILLKVGRREDAEDLTHHVFLSAWEHVRRYEHRGFPFSSWLYRIASNAVIDHYRTARHHQNLETVPEEVFAETDPVGETVDAAIGARHVRAALMKLDPDQQNVLIMRFVGELSSKEIAEVIGKSEGAVRVIQHRALKQLKKFTNAQ
jgi:RNA polymerase sigma-70 factor (ECF subfamily)